MRIYDNPFLIIYVINLTISIDHDYFSIPTKCKHQDFSWNFSYRVMWRLMWFLIMRMFSCFVFVWKCKLADGKFGRQSAVRGLV